MVEIKRVKVKRPAWGPREIPLVTVNITVCSECGEVLDAPHATDTCPKFDGLEHVPKAEIPELYSKLKGRVAPFVVDAADIHDDRKLKPLTQVGPKQNGDLQEFEEK